MNDATNTQLNGDALVADFQTVFVSGVTVETAKYQAKNSEDSALDYLNSINRGSFLNPSNIPVDNQAVITRASVDAHIKKVQAKQMEDMNELQLNQLVAQDQLRYKGKKVQVTVLDRSKKPIETAWYDNRYGWRKGIYNRVQLSGIIEDILLEKNALILKPVFFSRLVSSSLKNYFVYVIDPDSLTPMIKLKIR